MPPRSNTPFLLPALAPSILGSGRPRRSERRAGNLARKHLSEHLNQVQRLLMQGELGASAVHEISNLLTIVLFNGELLRERCKNQPAAKRYIEPLLHAANHIALLCGQLRNLSRPIEADLQLIDLVETSRHTYRLLAQIISRELSFEVPPGAQPVMARADPARIDQMLVNLVLNARDATAEEGGRIVVRVGCQPDKANTGSPSGFIEVQDNGQGMTAKVKRQLFKTFFTTKAPGQGTGLGLATVRRLMRGMGGEVEVESRPGQGARLRLVFPPATAVDDRSVGSTSVELFTQP
jgi:two-component system cell cycle sensor histidine kinase/response regulator CckA